MPWGERLNSLVFTERSGVKIQCSDLFKAFIINLLYIKSGHLANLLILAFQPNTYDLKHLVSIMLLNKLLFGGFGNTAISGK